MKSKTILIALGVCLLASVHAFADNTLSPPCCTNWVEANQSGPSEAEYPNSNPLVPYTYYFVYDSLEPVPGATTYVTVMEYVWELMPGGIPDPSDPSGDINVAPYDAEWYAFAEWYAAAFTTGSDYVLNSDGYVVPINGASNVAVPLYGTLLGNELENLQYGVIGGYPPAVDFLADPDPVDPTPEPAVWVMMATGLTLLLFSRLRANRVLG